MKLASVEKILELRPIEGADRIECATVLGYQTVVKKGEFKVWDLCVWHSPDTICDISNPIYLNLRKNWDGRIRVCKFKKQVSQGLALPMNLFSFHLSMPVEGMDISDFVRATKYIKEIPAQLAGIARGHFPPFLKKTDEDNIRSNPKMIDEFKGKKCYITKKYDGSSVTFYRHEGIFGVCSRNLDLKDDESNVFWKMARKYKIADYLKDGCALQAEVIGPGIQKNKLNLSEIEIRAFNSWDISGHKYWDFDYLQAFCHQHFIPIVEDVWFGYFEFSLQELIELANKQEYSPGNPCEGIVIRPYLEAYSEVLNGRLSGKIISEVFAQKYGE
jgi:RNA ligase (TIGR02306 family)